MRCCHGYLSRARCRWFSYGHCYPVISCIIKIQIGLAFLLPAYPGSSGKEAIKCASVALLSYVLSVLQGRVHCVHWISFSLACGVVGAFWCCSVASVSRRSHWVIGCIISLSQFHNCRWVDAFFSVISTVPSIACRIRSVTEESLIMILFSCRNSWSSKVLEKSLNSCCNPWK